MKKEGVIEEEEVRSGNRENTFVPDDLFQLLLLRPTTLYRKTRGCTCTHSAIMVEVCMSAKSDYVHPSTATGEGC